MCVHGSLSPSVLSKYSNCTVPVLVFFCLCQNITLKNSVWNTVNMTLEEILRELLKFFLAVRFWLCSQFYFRTSVVKFCRDWNSKLCSPAAAEEDVTLQVINFWSCGFRNVSSANVKAWSLSLKPVHYYIANCRTFKIVIIFINNASKMKPFYISKEMTRGRLLCAMNCRRKLGSYSVCFTLVQRQFPVTVWSSASKYILSLGETEDECVLQTT